MKTQLLMIIAVMLSSVLTISQRANAQETSQLRWLEPTIEQRLGEVTALDQEKDSDNAFISNANAATILYRKPNTRPLFAFLSFTGQIKQQAQPRAPPFS